MDPKDAIFESLEREFCPPLDSSLLAALLADVDLDANPDISPLRSTLIELAAHADESETLNGFELYECSDETSSAPDFCTTATTTTTSASDFSSGVASFNSPLGFLHAALPDVPAARLVRAVSAVSPDGDEVELDMWEIISTILSEETEREMRERDLDERELTALDRDLAAPEGAWETVAHKKAAGGKKKSKPKRGKTIALSDVRQKQHAPPRAGASRRGEDMDPWATLTSLATHLASLLPAHPPAFFLSFFHDPGKGGGRTPYGGVCAALSTIASPSSGSSSSSSSSGSGSSSTPADGEDGEDVDTETLFHLLDMLLPAYSASVGTENSPNACDTERLLTETTLALRAAQGRADDAFELVGLLRELAADEDGRGEMGVYHSPLTSPTVRSPVASPTSETAPPFRLPMGPAPTPPPPKLKPPLAGPAAGGSGKVNPGQWQAVPARRRAGPLLRDGVLAKHIPAYKMNVSGVRVRSATDAWKVKGGVGVGQALRRRDELLREAARMWQRGKNGRGRGGEVAWYFAERAREYQEVAKREALDAARGMVLGKRSASQRDTLDLHGVTAAEAVVIVEEVLAEGGWGGDTPLRIITGRGAHSANQVSVLKPAVRKALEGDGWVVGAWEGGLVVRGRLGRG
ncbi:hypothetical protein DFH07DRAFT_1055848 [Mycena maculata]|uniref:Smr domain-containing protein n=1 Tax=Mycena maculata TaxID=230809 RepID=A0AAD7K887_9AGAR|nr:hypothetical protein DFH07DRAFT_1055848 [Mycena maculata]